MTPTVNTTTPTIKPLTPVVADHEPSRANIQLLRTEIFARAKNMSTKFNSPDGHLGVVLDDATYAARHNGVSYDTPVHPGEQAPLTGGTVAAAEATRVHTLAVDHFTLHENAQNVLRELIIEAVPIIFIAPLWDVNFAFADVTPRTMITFLTTTYGTMDANEEEDNRDLLKQEYNPDEPLAGLWARNTKIQQNASPGAPISDATVMTLTTKVLDKTGIFGDDIKQWNDKPPNAKTMVNFKEHFNKAHKERRRPFTAGTAGLHGANANLTPGTDIPAPNTHGDPHIHPTVGGKPMAYCYTHGASQNIRHTSAT